jgi:hypothetical protein
MATVQTKVNVTLPLPLGGTVSQTPTGFWAGFKSLFGIGGKGQDKSRVVDAGNGQFSLLRKGHSGAMRLNLIGKVPTPKASTTGSGPTVQTQGPDRPTTSSTPGSKGGLSGSGGMGLITARREVNKFIEARTDREDALSDNLSSLRAAQDARAQAKPGSKQEARLATTEHLKLLDFQTMATKGLADLAALEKRLPSLKLNERRTGELRQAIAQERQTLTLALIGAQLPSVGRLVSQQLGDAPLDLRAATGKSEATLRARYDAQGDNSLVESPGGFVDGLGKSLGKLQEAGLLKPELLHRIAEFGRLKEWAKEGNPTTPEAIRQKAIDTLDATQHFAMLLKGVADGDATVVDFLFGKDHALDDYALSLKLEMGKDKPGFDADKVRLEHSLSRTERTVKELLRSSGKGNGLVFDGRGEGSVRIDTRLLKALRTESQAGRLGNVAAHKNTGRDVNMLIAHAMLLQKALGAKERGEKFNDLQLQLAVGMEAVTAFDDSHPELIASLGLGSADELFGGLKPGTQIDTPGLGNVLARDKLKLAAEIGRDMGELAQIRDKLNSGGAADLEEVDRLQARAQQLMDKIEPEMPFLKAITGKADPTAEDLQAFTPLAQAVHDIETTRGAIAQIRADSHLGLEPKDLKAIGLTDGEISTLWGDLEKFDKEVGGLARQGLKNGEQVKRATEMMNRVMDKVLTRGLAQDQIEASSKRFPDARARLYVDAVLRQVTGQKDGPRPDPDGGAVKEGIRRTALAYADKPRTSSTLRGVRETAQTYAGHQQKIGDLASELAQLDSNVAYARQRLGDANADMGYKVKPDDPKGFAVSKALMAAVETHFDLVTLGRQPPSAQRNQQMAGLRAKLAQELGRLDGLDVASMSTKMFGGTSIESRRDLVELLNRHPELLTVAQDIITIRSAPEARKAIALQMDGHAQAMDEVMFRREGLMTATDGTRSDLHVRHAVRAAVLLAREEAMQGIGKFDPFEARDEIEARLQSWGIDPLYHKPEIDDVLLTTLDGGEVETWLAQAGRDFGKDAVDERSFGEQVARAVVSRMTDNVGLDPATRHSVLALAKEMRVGDKVFVAQGDGVALRTGKIPVDPSGTLKVKAEISAGKRTLFELQRTAHGYELFFKGGTEGKGKLGVNAGIFQVAEVGGAIGFGGKTVGGVGVRFGTLEDATAFLDKMMTTGEVRPTDWHAAQETVVVDDRTREMEVEAEASVTTKTLGEKVGWVKDNLVLSGSIATKGDVQLFAGVQATVAGKVEWREVRESNVDHTRVESETVWQVKGTLLAGAYVVLPTAGDLAGNLAMDRLGGSDALGFNPFIQPQKGVTATVSAGTTPVTQVHGSTILSDGQFAPDGLDTTWHFPLGGKPDRETVLGHLPDFAGKAMRGKLDDPTFGEQVDDLLAKAGAGDRIAVSFAVKPSIRDTINNHAREARRLQLEATAARDLGQSDEASSLDARAKVLTNEITRLMRDEDNYEPNELMLVKDSQNRVDMDVFGVTPLKWTRFSEGGSRRLTASLAVPGGAASRAEERHVSDSHGHGSDVGEKPQGGTTSVDGSAPIRRAPQPPPPTKQALIDFTPGATWTSGPVPVDKPFYFEPQSQSSCTIHATNAAFGGQATSVQGFSDWIRNYGAAAIGGQALQQLGTSSDGVSVDIYARYLEDLHTIGRLPSAPQTLTIDPSNKIGGVDYLGLGLTHDVPPDPQGDRCVLFQSQPPHYVAFRKDAAGEWRLIDSRNHPDWWLERLRADIGTAMLVGELTPDQQEAVETVRDLVAGGVAGWEQPDSANLDLLAALATNTDLPPELRARVGALVESIKEPQPQMSPSEYMRSFMVDDGNEPFFTMFTFPEANP